MEQLQLGFSDSTQKPASDRIQKKWKKLDYNYNKYPIVKLAPKSAGQVISTLHIQSNYRPIRGSLKNHSDVSEAVLIFQKFFLAKFKRPHI